MSIQIFEKDFPAIMEAWEEYCFEPGRCLNKEEYVTLFSSEESFGNFVVTNYLEAIEDTNEFDIRSDK